MQRGLPLDREAFTTFVAAALAQAPDIEVLSQTTLSLGIRANGVEGQMNLDNAYAQYCRAPEALDKLTDFLVSQVQSFSQTIETPPLTDAIGSLYPQVKPISYLEMVRAQGIPSLVSRPLVADLVITYVMDRPDSMIPITVRHTATWQIDEPTLHQIAMSNLAGRETEYSVGGQGPHQLFFCQSMDGYDATRILLADLLDEWAARLRPHRLLLGLPNRDFLIGFSDADPDTVAAIAAQVRRDAASRPYSITGRLLVWENGTLREYQPIVV